MKKRVVTVVAAAVLVISMSTTAFAGRHSVYRDVYCKPAYNIMMDDYGYLLDRKTFEANLDKAVKDGIILPEDRDIYIDRYDYCESYYKSYRGGCCRR